MNQELIDQILSRYTAADNYLVHKRDKWDEYEDLFHNVLTDSVSDNTKSQMFDPVLSTMAIERSNRVMAQFPTGKVRAMSKNDEGASKLMNLILEKYIVPNAKSQFDMLTKMRMVDLYSNIYGNFFTFVGWVANEDGYIGPDVWMLPIRDVFPQVGQISLNDSDYVIVRTWKSRSFFESLKDNDGFINIKETLKKLENASGSKDLRSEEEKGRREGDYPDPVAANKSGQFSILSMYERDRWVDYVPFTHTIIRDIENPQENGELPVTCKYSIPLIDDFMGMGDFERGKTEQYALNSLWNLYMDAVKISIFPPTLINKDFIADANSIKWGAAEKWLVRGPQTGNAAQVLNLTPQGTSTFNNVYQALRGSMLNQFGTTFTDTATNTDTLMGKTPQALKMQAMRENTRDSADRFFMEQYLKETINRMCNLVSKKQPRALSIRLFEEEIADLVRQYPEMEELYNEKTGEVKINKSRFKNYIFDYEIVSGSTYQADQQEQQANLLSVLELALKNPELIQYLQQVEGKKLEIGEIISRIMANSGIQDWDKILVDETQGQQEDPELIKQQANEVMAQALQEAGLPPESIPPELINQIPAQPEANGPGY